jgi:hypothetical protein
MTIPEIRSSERGRSGGEGGEYGREGAVEGY